MSKTKEELKKMGLGAKFYFTANDLEKKHYRTEVLKYFKISPKHFYKWIESEKADNAEALALWQYIFGTEIFTEFRVKAFKFHESNVAKYKEPELF